MRRAFIAFVVAGCCLAACGRPDVHGVSGSAIEALGASVVPTTVGGLEVHAEGVKNLVASTQNAYVSAVGLYSLRENNLVEATLQVNRLTDKFDYKNEKSRALLADRIGGSRSDPHKVGSDIVYLTQGLRQQINVWFRGKYFFVLSVRVDYPSKRALLRDALEVNP